MALNGNLKTWDGSQWIQTEAGIAIPDSVVDNFEDGPDGPYGGGKTLSQFYTGDVANFDRVTTNPIAGTYTLELTSDGSMFSTSLPNLPSTGTTFSTIMLPDRRSTVFFGGTDTDNTYFARLDAVGEFVQAAKRVGGVQTEFARPLVTVDADNYEVEIDWRDSTSDLIFTFYEWNGSRGTQIAQITQTDGEYDSGGIGWGGITGTNIPRFDELVFL